MQVQYLLNKLENNDKIDENLCNYFYDTLKGKKNYLLKYKLEILSPKKEANY